MLYGVYYLTKNTTKNELYIELLCLLNKSLMLQEGFTVLVILIFAFLK